MTTNSVRSRHVLAAHGTAAPTFTLYLPSAAGELLSDGMSTAWLVDFNQLLPDRPHFKAYLVTHSMYSSLVDVTNSTNTTFEEAGLVTLTGLPLARLSAQRQRARYPPTTSTAGSAWWVRGPPPISARR